jgi:hypothetical protein
VPYALARRIVAVLAAIIALTAIVVVLLTWKISRERGDFVSPERVIHPIKSRSLFSPSRLLTSEELEPILRMPFFPQASGTEQVLISWMPTSSKSARVSRFLSFVELTSTVSSIDVEQWYADRLDSGFQKRNESCDSLRASGREWLQTLAESCAGAAILFTTGDEKDTRGALIWSSNDGRSVIRIFRVAP